MNRRQFLTGLAASPLAEIAGVAPPSGTDFTQGVRNTSSANPIELYNLVDDLGETTHAASQHPEVVAKIAGILSTACVASPGYPVPGEPL